MKKLTFTFLFMLTFSIAFAQVITNLSLDKQASMNQSNQNNQTRQLVMTQFTCSTHYAPSTNGVVLSFTLDFSSPDVEYADYVKLVFPAGFTVISATAIGTTNSNTVGQDTATWGSTPAGGSGWGDISGANYNFTVTVDIGAISGQQTINYSIIGDGYGAAPHTLTGTITVDEMLTNDVLAQSIDINPVVYGAFAPQGTAFNNGSTVQSFDMIMEITPGAYKDTVSITSLASATASQETFASFTPSTEGAYNVTLYTILAGDGNLLNDTITGSFYYVNSVVKAFAWNAYSPTGTVNDGPLSLITNSGTLTSIAADTNTVFAGTWINSNWYVLNHYNSAIFTVDTTSGALTAAGAITGAAASFTGIAYDYTTSTLYGVTWEDPNTVLYSINLTTGAATSIGSNAGLGINLACDHNGNLFTVNIIDDSTYAVNKSTGAWTGVGPVGADLGYAQDMEYDHLNHVCYMAAYNSGISQGELRILDLATGMSYLVEAFTDKCEVTALAIPVGVATSVNNSQNIDIKVYPNPSNGVFTIVNDNDAQIFVYDILGNLVFAKEISANAQIDLSNLSEGNYFLKLVDGNNAVVQQISIIK